MEAKRLTAQRLATLAAKKLKPLPHGKERETILCEGLVDLLAEYGHHIRRPWFDSNGEVSLNTEKPFGEGLAAELNRIPVRHGINPTQGHVLPEGQWCRIHHFDLEKLLRPETVDTEENEGYDYVKAKISDGTLTWEYKATGAERPGKMSHDEDVSEWSDDDIRNLTAAMLSVPDHQRAAIEIRWL